MDSDNIIADIIPYIILLLYQVEGRKRGGGRIFAPDK
jgi:hypothetical protein